MAERDSERIAIIDPDLNILNIAKPLTGFPDRSQLLLSEFTVQTDGEWESWRGVGRHGLAGITRSYSVAKDEGESTPSATAPRGTSRAQVAGASAARRRGPGCPTIGTVLGLFGAIVLAKK